MLRLDYSLKTLLRLKAIFMLGLLQSTDTKIKNRLLQVLEILYTLLFNKEHEYNINVIIAFKFLLIAFRENVKEI